MKYAMTNIDMTADFQIHDAIRVVLKCSTPDEEVRDTNIMVTNLFIRIMHDWTDILQWSHDFGEFVDPDLDEIIDEHIMPWVKSVVADAIGPLAGFLDFHQDTKPKYQALLDQIEAKKRELEAKEDDGFMW